jgi:hypothetical protein
LLQPVCGLPIDAIEADFFAQRRGWAGEQITKGEVLASLGLTRKQAAQFERMGAMTDEDFNYAVGDRAHCLGL